MLNIGDVAHQNSGSEVPVSNPASTNPDVLQGYCEILHRGKPTPEAKKGKVNDQCSILIFWPTHMFLKF